MATVEELSSGVRLKLDIADFHLREMNHALEPLPTTGHTVVQGTAGLMDRQWHLRFHAHRDGFLAATKSIPDILKWQFGVDDHKARKFGEMPSDEQSRRRAFMEALKTGHAAFRKQALCLERDITLHRTGYPDVTVTITGPLGVVYRGTPIKAVPTTEPLRQEPDFSSQPVLRPIRPDGGSFVLADGTELLPACVDHLHAAQKLASEALQIAERVHRARPITP
jgi:hypothetical protein